MRTVPLLLTAFWLAGCRSAELPRPTSSAPDSGAPIVDSNVIYADEASSRADPRPRVSDPVTASPTEVDVGSGQDRILPVSPNASFGAKRVLAYLQSIRGKKVVTGQLGWWHEGWCNNPDYSLWPFIAQETGRVPALYGGEIWTSDVAVEVSKLTQMWNARTLITLQWHAPNPAVPGSTAWVGPSNPALSADQWKELMTSGSALNDEWLAQIDKTAGYLKQLMEAGVPVIWRPFHESHGDWFWWGTRHRPIGAARALYQMMFDRFTKHHGLDNLIWNWNTGGTDIDTTYPGAKYVDIVSMDAYGGPLSEAQYRAMLPFGKLMAWGEWGLDDQSYVTPTWILSHQPRIIYVMQWYGGCTSGSASPTAYKTFFSDPNGIASPVALPLR
jgi:mannan endo-1,4-beta-mannosidase